MSVYYRRRPPESRETLGAGLVALTAAAGVAAVTFYFTRLFLARESIPSFPPSKDPGEEADSVAPSEFNGES